MTFQASFNRSTSLNPVSAQPITAQQQQLFNRSVGQARTDRAQQDTTAQAHTQTSVPQGLSIVPEPVVETIMPVSQELVEAVERGRTENAFADGVFTVRGQRLEMTSPSSQTRIFEAPRAQDNPFMHTMGSFLAGPIGVFGNIAGSFLGPAGSRALGKGMGDMLGFFHRIAPQATRNGFLNIMGTAGTALGAFMQPITARLTQSTAGSNLVNGMFGGVMSSRSYMDFYTSLATDMSNDPQNRGLGFANLLSQVLDSPSARSAFLAASVDMSSNGSWDPLYTSHLQQGANGRQMLGLWPDIVGKAYVETLQRQNAPIAQNPDTVAKFMRFMKSMPAQDFTTQFSNWDFNRQNPTMMAAVYRAVGGQGSAADNALMKDLMSEMAINAMRQGVPNELTQAEWAAFGIDINQGVPKTQDMRNFYLYGLPEVT